MFNTFFWKRSTELTMYAKPALTPSLIIHFSDGEIKIKIKILNSLNP